MLDFISFLVPILSVSATMTPVQSCEIKTQAWCLVSSGVLFDTKSLGGEKREWTFYGGYLGVRKVTMIETRSCSTSPAREPKIDNNDKYDDDTNSVRISIILNSSVGCRLEFTVPDHDGGKDSLSLEFIESSITYCESDRSPCHPLSYLRHNPSEFPKLPFQVREQVSH